MQVQPAYHLLRRALNWDLRPLDVLRLVRDDPHPVALLGAWRRRRRGDRIRAGAGPQPAAGPR